MYLFVALAQVTLYGAVGGVVAAGVIFTLAGRSDLWNVWVYSGIFVVLFSFQDIALYRKNPDLLKERYKPAPGGRGQLLVFVGLLVLLLHWSIAGLDQRFHWSDIVPPAGVVAGLVVVAVGHGLFAWSISVNPFFSSQVRIQSDRGQRVIREGPYAIVRHPGYVGQLLFAVASGVALNSLFAVIITVLALPILVRRTAIEDRMLQNELAGYADYAAKVRYRLIPGVW
jgi:protein-S-isoprenylcysteine O-methyltransferase Ste14